MAITGDDSRAERMRLLRSHGMTTLTWDRHRGHAASYDVVALGYNYRIDEPRAALARARLERLDTENERRRVLDGRYRERLAGVERLSLLEPPAPNLASSHHLFVVVLDQDVDRDAFRGELAQRGVQTSLHYPPVHHFSIYREAAPALPVTDEFAARAVSLPMFSHMTDDQQDLVVEAVRDALIAKSSLRAPRDGAADQL
jgi:dTDP-4-amino-4,6-dideoxygalactose transaminase